MNKRYLIVLCIFLLMSPVITKTVFGYNGHKNSITLTELELGAMDGDLSRVKTALKSGAKINHQNVWGETALI